MSGEKYKPKPIENLPKPDEEKMFRLEALARQKLKELKSAKNKKTVSHDDIIKSIQYALEQENVTKDSIVNGIAEWPLYFGALVSTFKKKKKSGSQKSFVFGNENKIAPYDEEYIGPNETRIYK